MSWPPPRRHLAPSLGFVLVLLGAGAGAAMELVETPYFKDAVAAGRLPAVDQRVPSRPSVVAFDGAERTIGRHGGDLRMLMARAKDTRQMVVYGYARLIAYDRDYRLRPDILESIESDDARSFTLRLRPGHRWSDGHPFTSEDFRYYWEDVANNQMLSPTGPPARLLVEGEPPRVEILDQTTVRYSWSRPNQEFLTALSGASPLFLYRPAHYLKGFHEKHADPEALENLVADSGQRNWAALHNINDNLYKFDNPDQPTLQPWVNTTKGPSERFIFVRNPYYYRVDVEGRQLPYIDRVVMQVASSKIITLKTTGGETDLQARYLRFDDYTVLKSAEARNNYSVRLWRTAKGSHIALYPNLNVVDDTWRALIRDVRFRRALSLAINRYEINQVLFYGLGRQAQDTVLPGSPLYRDAYASAWTDYDIDRANALLDEIGLTARDSDGVRLLPDGRLLEIIVETAGESTEQTDVLELIRDSWAMAGVKLFTKPLQRQVLRFRIYAGQTLMSVWSGMENGLPRPTMSPAELAPTQQIQLQWPKWGQYYETKGMSGEPPDLPEAKALMRLLNDWYRSTDPAEQEAIWHRMLAIRADQVFNIGIISAVLHPVVVAAGLRNVPEKGVWNWDPGAHFGVYKPDTFWFDTPAAPPDGAPGDG
jgi:peptide/nickel transport system substrate-binding protein